jgi:DNA repair protein RecO (recombination protein O)
MQWVSDALVLAWRPLGEGQAILSVLTAGHGRCRGAVPGGGSRTRRHLLQQGNRVVATWRARHADQLGTLTCELEAAVHTRIIHDRHRLAALAAACGLLDATLAEREPAPGLYAATSDLIARLAADADWLGAYADWEARLLADLGFAMTRDGAAPIGSGGGEHDLARQKLRLAAGLVRLTDHVLRPAGRPLPFPRQRLAELVAALRLHPDGAGVAAGLVDRGDGC